MSNGVTLYTTRFCPYCIRARSFLDDKGVVYKDIAVDNDPRLRQEMMARSGRTTVPQIWVGEQHIGGCDDLLLLERQGLLDEILERVRLAY
jgi:glutaredoxin 3